MAVAGLTQETPPTLPQVQGAQGHSIIGFIGDPGSGKTLLLTTVLCWEQEHGRSVFSTYHITYPMTFKEAKEKDMLDSGPIKYVDFGRLLTLLQAKHKRYPLGSAVLALDEAYLGLDSRESNTPANKYLTRCLFQCRKLGLDIYYASQLGSRIDKSLRNITPILIVCSKEIVPYPKDPKRMVPQFHYYLINRVSQQVTEFMIGYDTFLEVLKYYDTQEIVVETDVQFGKEKAREMVADIAEEFEGSEEGGFMPADEPSGKANKDTPDTPSNEG